MTDYEDLDKFLLICKPCQSGKTSLVIENIKKLIQIVNQENIHNNVSIIFCDNSLLQTEQMNKRIESENINVKIISSKSEIKNVDELYRKIINDDIKVIICCANKTQIGNIDKLLEFFNISDKKNKLNEDYNFHFFIDEVDKTFSNSFFDNIKIWKENKKITKITVITATPKSFLEKLGSNKIPLLRLEESYNRDTYHKIDDSDIINIDDINFNIEYILKNYKFSDKCLLFCPGKVKKISHYDIQKILNDNKFNVLVINSDGSKIYYNDDPENPVKITQELLTNDEDERVELSKWLSDLYNDHKYKLKNKKFAITGHLSIGRGITISSPNLMITDAIIPSESSNLSNLYQLAGRLCGNMKKWHNYKKPRIFGTQKTIKNVIEYQNKVIDLVEHCYDYSINKISIENYEMLNADDKYGIPIKIRFKIKTKFKRLLEKIEEYKGSITSNLNDKSRNKIIKRIRQYCELENVCEISNYNQFSFNFDKDNYIIRNLKIIGYNEEPFEKVKKYPLKDINEHIEQRKRCKAESKNCENQGECIIYILCGNYQKFIDKDIQEGDIFITFMKN
jgi:hypothetical protein